MITALWVIILVIVFAFGFVLMFGAPYLPTTHTQRAAALKLMDLPKGSILLDLGCGDGRMLITAAKQGLFVVGYEINPLLAFVSWLVTRPYRHQVTVVWGNFWKAPLQNADGIYVFLLERYMAKLGAKLERECTERNVKVVSFAFQIPNKQTAARDKGVFLYEYGPYVDRDNN